MRSPRQSRRRTYSGAVAVTSNSADAGAGVDAAQFQTSPAGAGTWSNLGAADTASPYTVSWDTLASADGVYDLRVVTTDRVGNTFTSATVANVRVDNTAPTGSITAPAANAFVAGERRGVFKLGRRWLGGQLRGVPEIAAR